VRREEFEDRRYVFKREGNIRRALEAEPEFLTSALRIPAADQ
jgi:hypothetical protein